MSRSVPFLVVAVALAAPVPADADDWLYDTTVGLIVYDNVGRSRLSPDELSATALELDFNAQYQPAWRTDGVFTIDLFAGADIFDRVEDLGQSRVGLGAGYTRKIGLGREAPWWRVDARAGYHDFQDSARSGPAWQLGVAAGRTWDTGFDVRGRLDFRQHHGKGGATGLEPDRVFELDGWTARADGGYLINPGWALTAGLAYQRGDINTSTTAPGSTVGLWADDPAFGPGWRTYRIDARVVTMTLGANVELGPATQFIVAWDKLDAESRSTGNAYDSNIYRIQIRHEF